MSLLNRRALLEIAIVLFVIAVAGPSAAHLPINGGCALAVKRAMPSLKAAQEALGRGDARHANVMLDTALRNLGYAYYRPESLDDTGTHLIVAGIEERKGKLVSAATLKRRILVEWLELCGADMKG